jgi:hypothetical protein
LGLQIGLNFVPATKTEACDRGHPVIFVGARLSFFVAKMYGTAGSLTSTYRVVRNTTLRAESEIKHRRMTMREFQLSQFDPAAAGSTD